jgi:hypothetical protein
VLSFIRVIDRFTVNLPPKLPPGVQLPAGVVTQPLMIQFFLVVALKAGTIGSGKYHLRIKLYKPDGSLQQDNASDVFFQGSEDNGATSINQMIVAAPIEGLYWFDIYFEEALLTRIPLRVLHQQMMQVQLPQS